MKNLKQYVICLLVLFIFFRPAAAVIIEKIYAVVNGEVITYSEYRNSEIEMTQVLARQYQGDELIKEVKKMKENLLDRLISQKVILSFARDKKYDIEADVELIIKDIMKQNSIPTDEELRKAMASQGIDYVEWRKQIKENRVQQKYVWEQIGSKIKIDNSAIMEYYKNHSDQYTIPPKITLNCIFLNKTNYLYAKALDEKKETISAELKDTDFLEVAKKHSELPADDTTHNYFLGEFKKGELDKKLEEAALNMKESDHSDWLETDSGWYIIQLVKKTEAQLIEYKTVRAEIENLLMDQETEVRLKSYVEELKKDSHIKIFHTTDNNKETSPQTPTPPNEPETKNSIPLQNEKQN